jgi:hypothetical protein
MPGEGDLLGGRKDAYPAGVPRLRGKHERALGEVELPGDQLHLLGRETIGVGQDGELIAAEANRGKDVADEVAVAHASGILRA